MLKLASFIGGVFSNIASSITQAEAMLLPMQQSFAWRSKGCEPANLV